MKLFDVTKVPVLSKALDAYALRHKAIAANIANITTAGYRAKSVMFEDELSSALRNQAISGVTTDKHHIPIGAAGIADATAAVTDQPLPGRPVGDPLASGVNNVDLDTEMAELAKNQIRFKFSARLISDTFKGIQSSIRGTS